ncbi:hypothetical protein vseg_016198 [Gypsophila vaccaria]
MVSLETRAAEMYTMKVFVDFQEEVDKSLLACGVCGFLKSEDDEVSTIRDTTTDKTYKVELNVKTKDVKCSYKQFERQRILCRHYVYEYSGNQVKHTPDKYILAKWSKSALNRPIYDLDGNIVEAYRHTNFNKLKMFKFLSEIYMLLLE